MVVHAYLLQRIQLNEQLKTLQLTNNNGKWNELSRWEGHLRASERINTAVDVHFQDPWKPRPLPHLRPQVQAPSQPWQAWIDPQSGGSMFWDPSLI